jgi:adenylosuccinate synthase
MAEIGHEFGTVTGRRRRTGWLDTVMLRHAVRINSLTELALTKIDVLDDFDAVRVCIGYERNGVRLQSYPERTQDLAEVTPIYADLPGWQTPLRNCRERHDLPAAARAFLELVEHEVGVPITLVGTGPDRDHYLHFSA